MDVYKLSHWAKEIYENAVAHGWHEEKHSPEHYLGLIMTEVAEAVEADRKDRRSNATVCYAKGNLFADWYNGNVKNSIEEEFADIVIRLLDMAYSIHRSFYWEEPNMCGIYPCKRITFCEAAWNFVRCKLGSDMVSICTSIQFVYLWAEHLGIDLDQHIEWKMRYNALRDYKHGGKKY